MSWANLHVHSMFSLLDGVGSYEDYAARVLHELEREGEPGGPGYLAATEHGSMRGLVRLKKVADEKSLRPVFGVEFYVAKDHRIKSLTEADRKLVKDQPAKERRSFQAALEKYRGVRPRYHLTAWALNNTGLSNLIRLSSRAWVDGFYYRPRIDFDLLAEHSDGIAVGTACLSGPLAEPVLRGEPRVAVENAERLRDILGDRLFVEVMPTALPEQDKANRALVRIAERMGLPLLATTDTHYAKPKDWRLQEALLCVQTNAKMSDPDRFRFTAHDFWHRSAREMRAAFVEYHPWMKRRDVLAAIANTGKLAAACEADLAFDRFAALLPSPTGHETTPAEDFAALKDLCVRGWHGRAIPERARWLVRHGRGKLADVERRYRERLKRELRVFRDLKFSRYALIVEDAVAFARSRGIFVGPGRGSAGGSLVVFLLGITSIDPVEHDLLFERFIAPGRIDLPDIDIDFEQERRHEVIEYMVEKYGREHTAQITTFSSMKGRGCFRDVARVFGVGPEEINRVAGTILQRLPGEEREDRAITDSLKISPQCKRFKKKRPIVFSVAQRLEGTLRQVGLHAGGVVASPVPLDQVVPLESRPADGGGRVPVIAVDFRDAQELSLVKMDFLGLKNLTAIRHALQAIEEHHDAEVTLEDLETSHFDDADVIEAFNDHSKLVGIFQFDTTSMISIMRFAVRRFEDLVALNALNRPGAMRSGLAVMYAARADGRSKVKKTHPIVDEITASTLGVLTYQEQVSRIFVELAGYDPGDADKIRKKIGKSEGEKAIKPEEAKFIAGAAAHGLDPKDAAKLFAKILKFGGYAFNRSHAVEYSALAYWEMLLKVRYPAAFYLGLLQSEDKPEKTARYIEAASRDSVEVLTPDVNQSRKAYALADGKIRPPLIGIKGVGPKATESILLQQPFRSFSDLIERTESRSVNRTALSALILGGALDCVIPNRRFVYEELERLVKAARKGDGAVVDTEIDMSGKGSPDFEPRERARLAIEAGVVGPGQSMLDAYVDLWEALEAKGVELTRLAEVNWDEALIWTKAVARESKTVTTDDGRVASLVLADGSGVDLRARMEAAELDVYEKAVARAQGKVVLVRASLNAKAKQLRALQVWDGAALHNAWKRDELTPAQAAVFRNPLRKFKPRSDLRKGSALKRDWLRFTGRVEAVKFWKDKKGHTMAFFDVQAYRGSVSAVCFASSFKAYQAHLRPGVVARFELIRGDGGGWLLDAESGCRVEPLE